MKELGLMAGAIIVSLLYIGGCKKDPVGVSPPSSPREYKWRIDTLAYPGSFQTSMRAIWGSSSNDIYVCGHNSSAFGSMYHWNGQVWTNIRLLITEGGPLNRLGSFRTIFGFTGQNIYAAGSADSPRSFLIHFDGTRWRELAVPNASSLETVWGRTPDTVWIGGWDGYLTHYTNRQFIQERLPYTFDTTGLDVVVRQITGNAHRTFLVLGVSPRALHHEFHYFYERVGMHWQIRDSSYQFIRIFVAPGGTVYRSGYGGIQHMAGTTWTTTLSVPNVTTGFAAASSETNMFASGWGGDMPSSRLYHYNGTDWFEYVHLRMEDITLGGGWTDGNQVFVLGNTLGSPMKTVVLHGR